MKPELDSNNTAGAVASASPCSQIEICRLMASLPRKVFQRVSLHDLQNIVKAYNTGECPECSGGRKTGIDCHRCHGVGFIEFPLHSANA